MHEQSSICFAADAFSMIQINQVYEVSCEIIKHDKYYNTKL